MTSEIKGFRRQGFGTLSRVVLILCTMIVGAPIQVVLLSAIQKPTCLSFLLLVDQGVV